MNTDRYRKLRRMESDNGATPPERDTARRLRQRMESAHPGIRQAAAQADAREHVGSVSEEGDPGGPGPYETGYYGPPRTTGAGFGDRLRSFVQSAMDEVGTTFTLSDMVRQDVDIEVRSNTRTLHIHVRIPLDALDRVSDFTGGSLQEYARLVGVRVGSHLSAILRHRD